MERGALGCGKVLVEPHELDRTEPAKTYVEVKLIFDPIFQQKMRKPSLAFFHFRK